ncbi:MAG TPA: hypothetical protein VEM96_14975 [Pyrinomonadaceae bacterium]|nr:hypothetical protein [Pyrinomonadaceae bacterium]
MRDVLRILASFSAPAVVVAFTSALVGSFISYLGYRLNRKKEQFETHRYAQSIFRDLFELERQAADELVGFRERLRALDASIVVDEILTSEQLLLKVHDLIRTDVASVPLHRIGSEAANMHYSIQSRTALLVHSVEELLENHEQLLNRYERYRAYHTLLVNAGASGESAEKWLIAAAAFYDSAKASEDYASMIRIGITLVGVETERGLCDQARSRLAEISNNRVVARSGMSRTFLMRRFQFLTASWTGQGLPKQGIAADAAFPGRTEST